MGISDIFIKRMSRGPAIIGTTNTVAKQYLKLKEKAPFLEDSEIFETIIKQRYRLIPLKDEKKYRELINEVPKMKNLKELIFNILGAETELYECGERAIVEVLGSISEELDDKYNLK